MSSKLGLIRSGCFAFSGVLFLSVALIAQDKEKFAEAQQQNKEALKQYTWKSRTELEMKGESKNVTLEQVRYDLDGKLQKTPLTGGAEQQAEESGGGLKGKIVEKKKAEFAQMMKELGQLVGLLRSRSARENAGFPEGRHGNAGRRGQRGYVTYSGWRRAAGGRRDDDLDQPPDVHDAPRRDPDVLRGKRSEIVIRIPQCVGWTHLSSSHHSPLPRQGDRAHRGEL